MDYSIDLPDEELYELAKICEKNSDYDGFAIAMTKCANNKYHKAIEEIYASNNYKKQNYNITKRFYKDTAYNDNSFSINMLGYMYINGLGVKRNNDRGIILYKIGILKGNIYSMGNLAHMYQFNKNKKNKAIKLYRQLIETIFRQNMSPNRYINMYVINNLKILNKEIPIENRIAELTLLLPIYENNTKILKTMFSIKKCMIKLIIAQINEKMNYETRINNLKTDITHLETHILYSPGGEEYLKIKKKWDEKNNYKLST